MGMISSRLAVTCAAAWAFAAGAGFGWAAPVSTAETTPAQSPERNSVTVLRPVLDKIDRVDPPWSPKPLPKLKSWEYSVVSVTPYSSSPQGVGTIVKVKFGQDIPWAARWKVQENISIVSDDPKQDMSAPWIWLDGNTLAYRPKDFWNARQTLAVSSSWPVGKPLMRIAQDSSKKKIRYKDLVNIVITDPVDFTIKIGASQIFTVDGKTHQGVVKRDGKVIKKVPVSLGKSGWETASGIKTLMEGYEVKRLYNPGRWDVMSPYAFRLTLTGEFLHSASWNSSIGYANTSHGCTNLTISDAKWFYENSRRGDPVITVNTGEGAPDIWDGDGAPWNLSWTDWKAKSATAP